MLSSPWRPAAALLAALAAPPAVGFDDDAPAPKAAPREASPDDAASKPSSAKEAGKTAPGDSEFGDFVRFTETARGEGILETAIVSYEGEGGVRVDLLGAVHVADKAYYRKLQKRFESYDQLLYEMVAPRDVDPDQIAKSGSPVSLFQRALKDVLGLEFQLDGIDYKKKNFVHADLEPQEFARLQTQKGESLIGLLFKAMVQDWKRQAAGDSKSPDAFELLAALTSADSQRRLKLLFARELEDIEKVMAGIEEGTEGGSVIIVERNKAALRALRKGLDAGKKKFGIFYGAGHLPDMEKRLIQEFRLHRTGQEWLTAWDVRKSPGTKSAGSPKDSGSPRDGSPGDGSGRK
jgi:hypothetical protein